MTIASFAGGALVFLGVVVVLFFVVAYSYYSRTGSGINQRPNDGRDAPGAAGESHISTADDDVERTVGTRGTQ